MFKFSSIFTVNLMVLLTGFSSNRTDDNLNKLPELFEPDDFISDTKEFASRRPKVSIYTYPYMASVSVKMYFPTGEVFESNCSGAFLINRLAILTAAHCVVFKRTVVQEDTITIRFGTSNHGKGGSTAVRVEAVMVNSQYMANPRGITRSYDVAVVRILFDKKDTKAYKAIDPLKYPPEAQQGKLYTMSVNNAKCRVIGYGLTKRGRVCGSLEVLNIRLISDKECNRMLTDLRSRLYLDVCAYTEGVDPCHGGGGAVLLCDGMPGVTGIYGFGTNCGKKDRPAIFSLIDASWTILKRFTVGTQRSTELEEKPFIGEYNWTETIEEVDKSVPTNVKCDVYDQFDLSDSPPESDGTPFGGSGGSGGTGGSGSAFGTSTDVNASSGSSLSLHLYIFIMLIVEIKLKP